VLGGGKYVVKNTAMKSGKGSVGGKHNAGKTVAQGHQMFCRGESGARVLKANFHAATSQQGHGGPKRGVAAPEPGLRADPRGGIIN